MAYSTPGERFSSYLRRTTFRGLMEQALRDHVRTVLLEGQRADHLVVALEDIAVMNVLRRLVIGAVWAQQRHGEGAIGEAYLSDLIVNELLIDYANVSKVKDYLRPCARAARSGISDALRREVYQEHGYVCYMCGKNLARRVGAGANASQDGLATLDHLWPRGYGGDSSFPNLLPACHDCNNAKASMAAWSLFRFQDLVLGPHPTAEEAAKVGREALIAWQLHLARQVIVNDNSKGMKEALLQIGPITDIDFQLRRYPTDFFTLADYIERVGA